MITKNIYMCRLYYMYLNNNKKIVTTNGLARDAWF